MDIFLVIFWPSQSDNMDKNEPREKMYPDIDMENVFLPFDFPVMLAYHARQLKFCINCSD